MSVTASATQPARLDIQDMPRDTDRCLGGLRQALCASFNYCRAYPAKLQVLITVLEYVLARAKEFGTEEGLQAIADKHAADLKAKLDALLEERNSVATAATSQIKATAQAELKHAQGLVVLDELKEYIVSTGYEVVGETLEDVCAAYIKARTAKYKEDSKIAKDEVYEKYAVRLAAFEPAQKEE